MPLRSSRTNQRLTSRLYVLPECNSALTAGTWILRDLHIVRCRLFLGGLHHWDINCNLRPLKELNCLPTLRRRWTGELILGRPDDWAEQLVHQVQHPGIFHNKFDFFRGEKMNLSTDSHLESRRKAIHHNQTFIVACISFWEKADEEEENHQQGRDMWPPFSRGIFMSSQLGVGGGEYHRGVSLWSSSSEYFLQVLPCARA